MYVLWRPEAADPDAFARALREELGPRLAARGCRRVQVDVADADVAAVQSARLTRLDPPPSGVLSCWLDAADDRGPLEAALAAETARHAGYLVVESVVLADARPPPPLGERSPGVNMIALIQRPAWIEPDAWIAHWHGPHRAVALETQCTFRYVRNVVVRPLTADAPGWDGIVEEGFPTEAVTDPMLWYRADGSKRRLEANLGRMLESCRAFLDLDRVESHPFSRYRISDELGGSS